MGKGIERRDFLKVLGAAGAGAGLSGCGPQEVERLIPYVVQPEEIVPGLATWYRTTCRECPAGCGMSVRTREGRAVKAEGNPLSPISHGRLCARGQASLHGLYNPDRIPRPLARQGESWEPLGWDAAEARLAEALAGARGRTVLLSHARTGSMDRLLDEWAAAFGVERVRFDTFAWEPLRAANRLLFGVDAVPVHDFSTARYVVSFGADFLETWLSPVDYAHGFVQGHAYANGDKGHFVAVTPHQSLTDLNADEWLPIRPGTEHFVALAMARTIAEAGLGEAGPAAAVLGSFDVQQAAELSGVPAERIRAVAHAFANGGASLAVGPGVSATHAAATAVAAAVAILNQVAGNYGRTVRLDAAETHAAAGSYADLRRLAASARAGQVGALLLYGPNPLHSVPLPEQDAAALRDVPFLASFAGMLDDTSQHADLLLPDHHFLESWDDYVPRTGVHSLVQPVMQPVFETKQTGDVLLSVARRAGVALGGGANSYYDYLRRRWAAEVYPQAGADAPFEQWWHRALQLGVVTTQTPATQPAFGGAGLAQLRWDAPAFEGGDEHDFHLVVYPSYRFYDGRLANRPWLQELPDPLSKVTWGSWAELHPDAAEELDLENGSVVEVATPFGSAELPVWIHPGTRPDVVAIQLGQGHEQFGRYAQGRGINAVRLLGSQVEEPSGSLVWQQTRASVRATGGWERLAVDSDQYTTGGRHNIARVMTVASARKADERRGFLAASTAAHERPLAAGEAAPPRGEASAEVHAAAAGGHAPQAGHGAEAHPQEAVIRELQEAGGFYGAAVEAGPADYPPPGTYYGEYSEEQPRWGMAIDMERCIGCSACVTACYAENNIGIVGPDQVKKGRHLHWLRIERYWEGESDREVSAEHGARFLPMLCQQCGNAPCEPVCPVYASYHTPDGLNAQIYNRCVGTRYCANNCPYKVRTYNWFTWEWPEPLNWQLNPDVTVREKGVMEKCTFCVQRIRDEQRTSRLEERGVADGQIVPACAQTCPGEAIVFGDIADPSSRVARIAASGRGYRVLEALNTQSGIVYLQKVVAADGAAEAADAH